MSKLGFGTWGLGGAFGHVERDVALRALATFLEGGGSFIDTARAYGDAEGIVGEALRAYHGDPPLVATKVQGVGPGSRWGFPHPAEVVFPSGSIRRSLEASLRALRLERVDILQLHLYWPTWGVDGYWLDELQTLREEGKVGALGVSLPDYRHDLGLPLVQSGTVDSIQTIVNIFDPLALDCLAPLAAERSIDVIARGALDEGGLAGGAETQEFAADDIRSHFLGQVSREAYATRVRPLLELVAGNAASLAELALRFVLSQPAVSCAIVSMQNERIVEANLRACAAGQLDASILDVLLTRHRWIRNFFEPLYWAG